MYGDEPQPSLRDQMNSMNTWLMLISRSTALPAEVILRHGFGRDYFGLQSGIALLILLFWCPLLFPEHDPRPMLGFLALFVCLCGYANVSGAIRRRRGYVCHSRYSGTPRLMCIFRSWNEVTVKKWVETYVTVFGGVALLGWSPPLGLFLMVSGMALGNSIVTDVADERRRAQDIYDAYLEQQTINQQFRHMRGDGTGVRSGHVVEPSNRKAK
jgi:hypothetical protein